jgi:RimJ/RimL family protein N-acetyltransferase
MGNKMVQLKPMSEADFVAYVKLLIPDYAQERVKTGRWTAEESQAAAQAEFAQLLPNGLATENHYFFIIFADEETEPVGTLWFARQKGKAFIYDIVIHEPFRRRGYATQAFRALEDKVCQLGLKTISLHVLGYNHAARTLYQKLGYTETNVMMSKTLDEV